MQQGEWGWFLVFGRKKAKLSTAVKGLLLLVTQRIDEYLPTFRAVLDMSPNVSEAVDDDQIFHEMLSAGLAVGLQPVQNIWDEGTFERARGLLEDGINCDKTGFSPEVVANCKIRLEEYFIIYRDWNPLLAGPGNMAWDNVSERVLSHLGGPRIPGFGEEAEIINPLALAAVAGILVQLTGNYWQATDEKYKFED